ncbi:hypothetical protein [Plantactinospora sp. B5E13]|uniref:hypothetical protein n=1 Tax=Plantactinospora sp. B5E13 TaxID=3153758 RepID=UPI00325C73AE
MKTMRIAAAVLAVGLTLTACDGSSPSTEPEGAPMTSSAQPDPTGSAAPTGPAPGPTGSAAPTGVPPTGPTRGAPPSPGSELTLTGVVREGVERGCYLLDNYLLVGGPRDVITAGGRVTVTGRVQTDLMTTCQQGVPFRVETATRG